MEIRTDLFLGDSKEVLKKLPGNSIDLIVTSPPYADQRKGTYGGIHPDKYVEWFLPISDQLFRVLKPTGTFVLNIKEKVVDGERSTNGINNCNEKTRLAMDRGIYLAQKKFIPR
jgi:site-specific DNA-methyltransferase (adenine-specific)